MGGGGPPHVERVKCVGGRQVVGHRVVGYVVDVDAVYTIHVVHVVYVDVWVLMGR